MRYVLASTQMSPSSSPFSLRLGVMCSTYSGSDTKVLLAQKDEVIVEPADVSLVTFLSRNYFLLQNGAYDLFAARVPLCICDCECFCVRRRKTDLGRDCRNGLWFVGMEYFIFACHFVETRQPWVLLPDSFQRIQNRANWSARQ